MRNFRVLKVVVSHEIDFYVSVNNWLLKQGCTSIKDDCKWTLKRFGPENSFTLLAG